MTQLSYTGGAPFATSRRGGYDSAALAQAKDMIQRLGSYQGASLATGVPVDVLREAFPRVKRNEFTPDSLCPSYRPPEPPKSAPLPPAPAIDNDRIARLVMSVVAQRFRLKYADVKANRTGTSVERMARMVFVSCLAYFTSWSLERIADYCGYRNAESAAATLRRHEAMMKENPEDRRVYNLVRDRIASKIVAIVGG